jgi:hypothetical protein
LASHTRASRGGRSSAPRPALSGPRAVSHDDEDEGVWLGRLNKLFETAIKIAAILAALAAINLLDRKPHLVTSPVCKSLVSQQKVLTAYQRLGHKAPTWVKAAVSDINAGSPVSKLLTTTYGVAGSSCSPPVISAPLTFTSLGSATATSGWLGASKKTINQLISSTLRKGGWQIYPLTAKGLKQVTTKVPATKLSTSKYDVAFTDQVAKDFLSARTSPAVSFAQNAVTAAATVNATVAVANKGGGGASNVRVEPPPGFLPIGSTTPFDLAPGEHHFLTFSASGSNLSGGAARGFQVFGDPNRTVNQLILWGVGVGLALLALVAMLADTGVVRRRA